MFKVELMIFTIKFLYQGIKHVTVYLFEQILNNISSPTYHVVPMKQTPSYINCHQCCPSTISSDMGELTATLISCPAFPCLIHSHQTEQTNV